ncbi:MAG: metallophosphoesterase [Bacteroidales bacterium]|nr:metallophosphoesterase [Bacteroidales bacterium]
MEKILRTDNAYEAIDKINTNFEEAGTGANPTSTDIRILYRSKERERDLITAMSEATFLFFTDIHLAWKSDIGYNLQRIVQLANKWKADGKLTAVLNGGDNMQLGTESYSTYISQMASCNADLIQTVGNHDTYGGIDTYDAFIAPIASSYTGIIQPANAAANDLCYFYKDYGDVRVISYDSVYARSNESYLTAEHTWLESVLSDAITNEKYVIILTHYPFLENNTVKVENCSWRTNFEHKYLPDAMLSGQTIPDSACSIVDNFIDGGGHFVCWLTGHTHTLGMFTNSLHPRQLLFNLGSANNQKNESGLQLYGEADNKYDNLCYVGVNKSRNNVFFMKVGSNDDRWLQKRDTFVWDFANAKMITCY